jgi:hypothetical protein
MEWKEEMGVDELIEIIIMFFVVIFLVFVFCVLPMAYFDGSSKSKFLKEYQEIDIPWYQATFIDVQINNGKIQIHK